MDTPHTVARRIPVQGGLAALALLALPCAALAQLPGEGVGPDTIRVSGVVLDQSTGRMLSGVSVTLTPLDEGRTQGWRGNTTGTGRFQSPLLSAGAYRLSVEAYGFSSVSQDVALAGASEMDLRIGLVPEALELEPIVVTSFRRTRLEGSGFYQRRQLGIGHTFTRDEIQRRSPARVSDLFRMVPGTEIITQRGRGGAEIRLRRGCVPEIDDFLSVGDLEALEVYHGGAGTMTLSGSNCGTIMAWTREGGPVDGELHSLSRLVMALTVVGFGILLSR